MPEDNLINRLIDQFQIHSLLAEGPVASIYLAEDTEEQIQVALKIFPRNFFPPESLEAINQEIRAAAYLEHDLLVMPYACGLFDGHVYLAMPYAPGGSLRDLLASKKRLELDEVISVIKQVTMALDYMHKRGMNHRNIKPGNILLDGEGGVYLGDIGLPTVLNTVAVNLDLPVPSTPAYTAPEIAQGNLTARQSFDIYALGVVLFRMLTGHHPFEADNVTELLIHHINTPVPSILDDLPDSHPAIDRIVRQALAKNPRERFARAGDIADALTEAQQMSAAQYQAAEGMLPAEKPRLEEPGHSPRIRGFYGPALTLAQLPPGKRRRYLRQMARERRMQARDYRRSTISETRRQRMLIGGIVLGAAAVVAVTLSLIRIQQIADQRLETELGITQTFVVGAMREARTATAAASEAFATGTREALQAATSTLAAQPTATWTQTSVPTITLTPSPTLFAGATGLIAYVAYQDTDPDIFIRDIVTDEITRVTDNGLVDSQPAWSPDGRWLAYDTLDQDGYQHIYLLDLACLFAAEGCLGQARQLTIEERVNSSPVWSPDSRLIAYLSNGADGQWIRTVDLSGNALNRLYLPGDARLIEWAPDGDAIIYRGVSLNGPFEIMEIPLDGEFGDRVPLTNSFEAITFASFSPNYEHVIYTREIEGVSQLFLANAGCEYIEDCVIRRLTSNDASYVEPRFSPDGSYLLVTSDIQGNYDLYIMDLNGLVISRVTSEPYAEQDAVWQPAW